MLSTAVSTTSSERVVLTPSNWVVFNHDISTQHRAKSDWLTTMFAGKTPKTVAMPRVNDFVLSADGTSTGFPRFETAVNASGVNSLTSAGVKAFDSANRVYLDTLERRKLAHSAVLLDISDHVSKQSYVLLKSFCGALFDDAMSDLLVFYTALKDSHSKMDPVSMMEVWVKLLKVKMTSGDYFGYVNDLCEAKKQVELQFSKKYKKCGI